MDSESEDIQQKIKQFRHVFDENPVPFMLYQLLKDESGNYAEYKVSYANYAAVELLHTTREKVIGSTVSEVSREKLAMLTQANDSRQKVHDVRYDSYCKKYLDITAYRESEGYVAFVLVDITEQIRQEEMAKAERDRYSHLLDAVPNGIAVFDIVRGTSVELKFFNDEIITITGYTREEINERGVSGLCEAVPEDIAYMQDASLKAIRTKRTVEMQYRTYKKSGELRYFRAKMAAEETGSDTLTLYVSYTDMTMEKQAEHAIQTEMECLTQAKGGNLLAKCRVNVTKNIVDFYSGKEELDLTSGNPIYSDAVRNVVNHCATEEMGAEFHRRMMPENLVAVFAEGTHEFELEYRRNRSVGSALWVRTVNKLYLDPETQDVMCFMYTYNIDKEKIMQMIVDHVAETEFDLVGLLYTQMDLLHCVRSSEMESQMKIGEEIEYSVETPKFVRMYVEEELQEEVREKLSAVTVRSELEVRPTYTVAYPVKFQGEIRHKKWEFSYLGDSKDVIIFTRTDVTDLFREQTRQKEYLRDALLQAEQASHAKTDFLSHMSHEIRTPMNAIIGMSALAAQCVNDPKQVSECISKVGISARFLLSLINDILDMSRIESGKVTLKNEKFMFEELIGNVNTIVYNQAKEKGVDYDCVVTSFISPSYIGDEMKLQQILINLLGNAVKFTPTGGKAQFIVHQNKVENGNAYLTFTVNDTGIGISEAFQKRMFNPFEQANQEPTSAYQGTGLGLAIVKNLVDMMGGTISVNSIEGVGTEFTVNLVLGLCDDEQEYKLPESIHLEKFQALVVDDDVPICENTQAILREMGVRTEWVSSGKQAVTLVQERKMRQRYFDIVLLDWKMPDMDGIETARQLRAIVGPDVTIIVITAYDWSAIEKEAKAAGVNLLITKPIFKSTLMSAFHRVFSEKAQIDEKYQQTEYDFTGKNLLLVEDHILNVEVAKRLLENKNAVVEVAENGLRAIEKFSKSSEGYYDAVLMDIRMPVMDGLTAARSIRHLENADAATVPIIAMSANAFDEDVEKSRLAGMNAHLAKPIEPQTLYATLERFFLQAERSEY